MFTLIGSQDRNSGIDVLGSIPWGSHLCQFYHTQEELHEILVPFFRAGLENNEYCLWITTGQAQRQMASELLEEKIPDFNSYLSKRQIEIVTHDQWYLQNGGFSAMATLKLWQDKLESILNQGWEGLRATGNSEWVGDDIWDEFMGYEAMVTSAIDHAKMIAICSYRQDQFGFDKLIRANSYHQYALIKYNDAWELFESYTSKRITKELSITEREKIAIANSINGVAIVYIDKNHNIVWANESMAALFGVPLEQIVGRPCYEFHHGSKVPHDDCIAKQSLLFKRPMQNEMRTPNGRTLMVSANPVFDTSDEVMGVVHVAMDISQQKQSEQRQRLHVEQTPLGVIDWDLEFKVIDWNPGAARIFGYSKGEALGRHANFIIPPIAREHVDAVWRKLLAQKGGERSTNINITKDGRTIFCEWYNTPLVDSQGKVFGVASLVEDITARKQVEEEMLQQKHGLEVASIAGRVALWEWHLQSNVLEWSPVIDSLLGYEPGTFPRTFHAWDEIIHPEDVARTREALNSHLEKGVPYDVEYRAKKKDGSYVWWRDTGTCQRDEYNKAYKMSGACTNITERKLAEEQMRITLESIGDGFVAFDKNWRFVYVNAMAEGILGMRREKLLGKNFWEVFPLTLGTQLEHEYRRAAAGEIRNFDNFYEPWSRWFHNRCFPREGDGISVYFKDITERKQKEEELKFAKKQAETANEAKSQFLANMSHELRTPMNAIIGFSDLLSNEVLAEEQRDYVNLINRSGKHLLEIIGDVLDFSKIEAHKFEIENIDCSLEEILDKIRDRASLMAKDKGIEFKINIDTNLPAQFRTDPFRLAQCLTNLINNAIKFTDRGHVHVNISLVQVTEKTWIRFDIDDTGIGIPEDKQEIIFESFTQADGTMSRKYGGTGLGLAITQKLTELLGGQISVQSQVGKGSVFTLAIPADGKPTPPPETFPPTGIADAAEHAMIG